MNREESYKLKIKRLTISQLLDDNLTRLEGRSLISEKSTNYSKVTN